MASVVIDGPALYYIEVTNRPSGQKGNINYAVPFMLTQNSPRASSTYQS